jgi:CubicO group peptidase (beta-lactamase class C family)
MELGAGQLGESLEEHLWPLVEAFVGSHDVAGLAVAVVRGDEIDARAFGVRDLRTGTPVTPETMFHLASVSKPFVATAIVGLATERDGHRPRLDLDASIVDWVPEFRLADGRAGEVTARHLLTHTSGLPDVADYGWHDPQLGDDALSVFAGSLSDWRLQSEPGTAYAYSNAGYELLGLLLSRVTGTTFEDAMRDQVLGPLGMERSTFLRAEVPADLAAAPHVGMPLVVPDDAYPYTRRHAPSSSLHSNLVELCRWVTAHLEPRLAPGLVDLMWRPVVQVGEPPWDEAASLGWAVGRYRGHRLLGHSGLDPGFGSRLVLAPDQGVGVVVLYNSNTVSASAIAKAALDVVLADGQPDEGMDTLRALARPLAGPVAEALATSGPRAARAAYHRLSALDPTELDPDDDGFADAVWGAIELHRTDLVRPLLLLWTELRPDSPTAWTMIAWAHEVDGALDLARSAARRALGLGPEDDEAARILERLTPDP